MYDLQDFLTPVNIAALNDDNAYNDRQMGSVIKIFEEELPDLENIDLVILGIND